MPALKAGIPAPKFKLHDLEAGPFSLEEALKHGPVLLVFFKISCPTCQFTLPYLERLYQGLKGKSVPAIVGISQNNQKDTAAFLRQYRCHLPGAARRSEGISSFQQLWNHQRPDLVLYRAGRRH